MLEGCLIHCSVYSRDFSVRKLHNCSKSSLGLSALIIQVLFSSIDFTLPNTKYFIWFFFLGKVVFVRHSHEAWPLGLWFLASCLPILCARLEKKCFWQNCILRIE